MTVAAWRFTLDPRHPALPGHFPGRPLLPGVLLLDQVIAAAAARGVAVTRLQSVKFLQAVLPGETCEIVLQVRGGRLRAECRVAGRLVLQAVLGPDDPPAEPAGSAATSP